MPEGRTAVLCISLIHCFLLTQSFCILFSRSGSLLWQHWHKRVVSTTPSSQHATLDQVGMTIVQVLPTPLARYRRHGRLSELRWQCAAHALGLAVVPTDCLWAWYVPFIPLASGESSGAEYRRAGLRRYQQCGHRLEHDVRNRLTRRIVL
jgi:hypothetical protein